MADYLYLDIETIPTADPQDIAQIAASVSPPSTMTKADTIAAWEADKKPAAIAEAVAKTSFNGAFGSVCCIGWAWNETEAESVDMGKLDEAQFMAHAMKSIIQSKPGREAFHQTVIVGHYVADFDLRFLWQRAFVLGVKMPAWWPRDPKPWSKEVNDTMQIWAGAKGSISLDNLCKALRIEGKTGVDGSMVAGMWERGEYDAIAEYCRGDVERVRQVHRKMLVAMGEE